MSSHSTRSHGHWREQGVSKKRRRSCLERSPKAHRTAASSSTPPRSRLPAVIPTMQRDGPARPGSSVSRCFPRSLGCSGRESCHNPAHEESPMKKVLGTLQLMAAAGLLLWSEPARASSHMDAPLITLDDAANTTDVYAFVSQR